MADPTIEILSAADRRRRWSIDQKLRIVAESSEPGASVRAVAARHDVYPSLLHSWRRQVRRGQLVEQPPLQLLPVRLTELPASTAQISTSSRPTVSSDPIEITLPNGSQVRVGNNVSVAALRRVISVLRG
jgi:transposase